MIKVIVFDLDDTLINEIEYIKSGYKHLSAIIKQKYGLKESYVYDKLYNLFKTQPKNVFDRFLKEEKISFEKKDVLYLVEEYRSHFPVIELSSNKISLLEEIRKKGYGLAIITDGYQEAQKNKVIALNLEKYIDKIIITDELGRKYWKPHPKAYKKVKEYFDIRFEEMLYVGDNPEKDFYIKSVYPIHTVRYHNIKGVYNNADYYKEVKEDYSIKNLNELFKIIEKIDGGNKNE